MSTLSTSLSKLGELAVDFSELEVITLTGTLGATYKNEPASGAGGSTIKWSQLVSDSLQNPNGEVILAASTLLKFDGDSYKFISNDKRVTPEHLAAHEAAVKAGLETRLALLGFFRDTVAKVVKA